MKRQRQQEKLEELIGDLERELSESKSQVEALEETHQRLRDAERICQELADENRRLREEISGWQARVAASEEKQKQIGMLQHQLESLQAEHARVLEDHRQSREGIVSSVESSMNPSVYKNDSADAKNLQNDTYAVTEFGTGKPVEAADPPVDSSSEFVPKIYIAKAIKATKTGWDSIVRNPRLAALCCGMIILVIAGAMVTRMLSTEEPVSEDPIVFPSEATTVESVETVSNAPQPKVEPRVRGTFRTVRPTQVFSGPSENSALIANLAKGIKLNVVDSRNGWLEIHSKHGRPPGFIRQEATVRVGSN